MQFNQKYKIIQCKCGQIQIIGGKICKCKSCHKSTKIQQKKKFGFALKAIASFDNTQSASRFLQEFNRQSLKNRDFIGYKTFGTMENSEKNRKGISETEEYLVGICGFCREDILSIDEWESSDSMPVHSKCLGKESKKADILIEEIAG